MTEKGIVTGVEQMGGACIDRLSACPCIRTARNMKAMKHILKTDNYASTTVCRDYIIKPDESHKIQ